jgi:hypothetical protein
MCCPLGCEHLPFLVPLSSEDVLQSSQLSQGDQDFHLLIEVSTANDTKHIKSVANTQFFHFVPCHGWCDERGSMGASRGFYGAREAAEDVASF